MEWLCIAVACKQRAVLSSYFVIAARHGLACYFSSRRFYLVPHQHQGVVIRFADATSCTSHPARTRASPRPTCAPWPTPPAGRALGRRATRCDGGCVRFVGFHSVFFFLFSHPFFVTGLSPLFGKLWWPAVQSLSRGWKRTAIAAQTGGRPRPWGWKKNSTATPRAGGSRAIREVEE